MLESPSRRYVAASAVRLGNAGFATFAFCIWVANVALAQTGYADEKSTPRERRSADISGVITIRDDDPLGADRMARIEALIKVVQDDRLVKVDRLRIHKAMLRLGRMKALEAVPAIVERLDLHVSTRGRLWQTGDPPAASVQFPAIKALSQIGTRALPRIVDAVATQARSATFRWNALLAVIAITGNRKKADEYVRERIELYHNGSKRAPLLLGGSNK